MNRRQFIRGLFGLTVVATVAKHFLPKDEPKYTVSVDPANESFSTVWVWSDGKTWHIFDEGQKELSRKGAIRGYCQKLQLSVAD